MLEERSKNRTLTSSAISLLYNCQNAFAPVPFKWYDAYISDIIAPVCKYMFSHEIQKIWEELG